MDAPRISIAMCTCNGERFLSEQLESLLKQSLLPFELVVCDDASTDSTPLLVEHFAKRTPFAVAVRRNDSRLGVARNFEQAVSLCNGDLIFLADQDDVWHPEKIACLARTLGDPRNQAAFSNANIVADNLGKLGYTKWQQVGFTSRDQSRASSEEFFPVLLKHQIVTGAALAFKVGLRETALPIPAGWPHDAWLALIAAAQKSLTAVPEVLLDYRQHEGNLVGGIRRTLRSEISAALLIDRTAWYGRELDLWRTLECRLGAIQVSPDIREALKEKIRHLENRASLPNARWRRIPGVVRELAAGRYGRFARNWGTVAIDLLVK